MPVISRLETEKRTYKQEYIDLLCELFDVSSDFLLGKSDYGINVYDEDGNLIVLDKTQYLLNINNITNYIYDNKININISINDKKYPSSNKMIYRVIKNYENDKTKNLIENINNSIKNMNEEQLNKIINFIKYIIA